MADPSGYCIYDQLAHAPLAELGWQVDDVPWTTPTHWSQYDAVVIRSTWDYQHQAERFLLVLAEIEASTMLLNPLHICRWNLDKRYLLELEARGVAIVPTQFRETLSEADLCRAFLDFATTRLVVKPTISAGAEDTFPLTLNNKADWQPALARFATRPALLQPFVDAVTQHGEYSLFYFAGGFIHAILKTPKAGDFRVQEEHGGEIRAVTPSPKILAAGQRALDAIGERLLYARVDLIELADGTPALMELELIEPSLYFPFDAESPARFARAVDGMTSRRGSAL